MSFHQRVGRTERAVMALIISMLLTLVPGLGGASNDRVYRDHFGAGGFGGSDGSHAWSSDWMESGEADGPGGGAIKVATDSRCHTDMCLLIGREGGTDATVTRSFDGSQIASARLTFDFERHPHGDGMGSVVLSATGDGVSWANIDTFSLAIEDGAQQSADYDITAMLGSASAIRFQLIGGGDDSHMNVDNLTITVTPSIVPTFDQDLGDRTDPEGTAVSFGSPASHPTDDRLAYSATGLPPGITIDPDTGTISGTIGYTAAATSPHAVEVTVEDTGGRSATDIFTWTVQNTNRPPAVTGNSGELSVAEGDAVDLALSVSDPDGDVVDVTATGLPTGLQIDSSTGHITGTVADGTARDAAYTVTVTASDPTGATADFVVTIRVREADSSPTPPPTTTTTIPTTTTSTTIPAATTTSTTTPPEVTTTSTTTPIPVTTSIPEPATGDRSDPARGTEVGPTTTTTTVPADDSDTSAAPAAPPQEPPPPPNPTSVEEVLDAKNLLVVVLGTSQTRPAGGTTPGTDRHLEPREGLGITFSTAVETLKTNLLSSLILGILVAFFAIAGVDTRERGFRRREVA